MAQKEYKLDKGEKLSDGMKVPEGYFADFAARMADKLPVNEAAETPAKSPALDRSWWQRSRPFVYMAAMFAGIWLMTQMFSMMKGGGKPDPIEQNPIMTAALTNNDFVDDYVLSSVSEYELLDDLYEDGFQIEEYN